MLKGANFAKLGEFTKIEYRKLPNYTKKVFNKVIPKNMAELTLVLYLLGVFLIT